MFLRLPIIRLVAAILFAALVAPSGAQAQLDYRDLMTRVESVLREAGADYAAGDADSARNKVQSGYFELFENLEGPIRVNVSAARAFELEAEFAEIRKMIIEGVAVSQVAARIDTQIAGIWATLPALEQGVVLRAEPAAGESPAAGAPAAPAPVEPHWQSVVAKIGEMIAEAATVYEAGDSERAREMLLAAQFEGYKNSLLESAVRRFRSQKADAAFNAEFSRIIGLARDGKPARMIAASGTVLVDELNDVLPGLPLLDGMEAAKTADQQQAPIRDWGGVSDDVMAEIDAAIATYQGGDPGAAISHVQNSYFDVFEFSGMEQALAVRDPAMKTTLEAHFSRIVGLMRASATPGDLASGRAAMQADFDSAVTFLGGGTETPWALFVYALIIILREGFEAILIVTAIITYLVKTGNRDKLPVIYNSVMVALALSALTAVLLKLVFRASAASQEVLEGATMLLAAVVLFSMSYWLISKAEAAKWVDYIKGTVDRSLGSGSLKALWFASFLAVYREGAETVLFYQALVADAATMSGIWAIIAGFAAGSVGLIAVYAIMRSGALKLPIRPFFMATGLLLYLMAFVFAGKGMMELIEGKVITPTLIAWLPEIPALGIYPYLATLIPQLLLVLAALFALVVLRRRAGTKAEQEDTGMGKA
ncbi:high-affinity iron transporter [Paracoccus halophilus]|uniref:High-affinity iron transporter n=1 Tax=Paracoccus halophilus TaxID=376733 RepID=A0A1I0SSA2_9RHOB|nr:FTR1 family protein [Paracoccus halophilus]SFA42372.1 high-affinity iron transporter [Paracoccus halophilus]